MKNFKKQFKTIEQIFLVFLLSIFLNLNLQSQTSGPTAPDFKGFTPINNNNLVNEFDGSFNYSIPVLSLPSGTKEVFNMALTYRSGMSPNEDASWVGFGWNLNPGIIQRQLKGFPDDFKEEEVIFINSVLPILTEFKKYGINSEITSQDFENLTGIKLPNTNKPMSLGLTVTENFNNKSGFIKNYSLSSGNVPYVQPGMNLDSRGNIQIDLNFNLIQIIASQLGAELGLDEDVSKALNGFLSISAAVRRSLKDDKWGKNQQSLFIPEYEYSRTELSFKVSLALAKSGVEVGLSDLFSGNETIKFKEVSTKTVSGYLHTKDSYFKTAVVLDYYNENESGLSHRNKFLPIPFASSDNFLVSGYGLQGSFKFDLNQNYSFRPEKQNSSDNSYQANLTGGYDFTPPSLALGVDGSFTNKSMLVSDWYQTTYNNYLSLYNSYNKVYYDDYIARFNGEVTPRISNYGTDALNIKDIFSPINTNVNSDFNLQVNDLNNYSTNVNHNKTIDRNNFIRTKFSGDKIIGFEVIGKDGTTYIYDLPIENGEEGNLQYFVNELDNDTTCQDCMFSKDGKMIYFNGNISNKVSDVFLSNDNTSKRDHINNDAIKNGNHDAKYVTGRFTKSNYNSAFLLTKIFNSNYIDVTNDGPSIDDIGDYVLFHYRAAYNGSSKYEWREPYKGLTYNKNALSNPTDDIGTMLFGKKDVYYLEATESKTHVAVFVTNKSNYNSEISTRNTKEYIIRNHVYNSNTDTISTIEKFHFIEYSRKLNGSGKLREDCLPAIANEHEALQYSSTPDSVSNLQYLERVLLFSKDLTKRESPLNNKIYLENLISTVNFVYDEDYPIWNGMPNSKLNKGKLTLKAVFFENELVSEDKTNPYIFKYEIESDDIVGMTTLQKNTTGLNDIVLKGQTPNFNYWNVDKWNNYNDISVSGVGKEEFLLNNNFSIQTKKMNGSSINVFDHSAWNLKKVILPQKSEILVNYEENEYSYVQNRHATLMFNNIEKYESNNKKIKISKGDLFNSLGLESGSTISISEIKDFWLQETKNKFIFYKYLFEILNTNDLHNLGNEYITGFNKVTNIQLIGDDVVFTFEEDLPFQKCRYFESKMKGMIYNDNNNVIDEVLSYNNNNNYILTSRNEVSNKLDSYEEQSVNCSDYFPEFSYIKLPIPEFIPKKGGGVRVKNIVNIDRFDLQNEANSELSLSPGINITGNEYIYKTKFTNNEKNFSSGVATNEPELGFEENCLFERRITLDEESSTKFDFDLLLGIEFKSKLKEFDDENLLIGSSVLISPSVNYSKIYTKPLQFNEEYKSKTIVVKEFFTVKDYPFDADVIISHPRLSETFNAKSLKINDISKYDDENWEAKLWNLLPHPLKVEEHNFVYSQSYQFIINDMHGKPYTISTYGYHNILDDESTWKLGTQTKYEYFNIGEAVPLVSGKSELTAINLSDYKYDWLGMKMTIFNESRVLNSEVTSITGDGDITFVLPVFAPTPPTYGLGINSTIERYKYFTTNKIIELPTLLKKTKNIVDGVETVVENVAFDAKTGIPLIQKTNSSYTNLKKVEVAGETLLPNEKLDYYKINLLANQEYDELGNISNNEGLYFKSNEKHSESFKPVINFTLNKVNYGKYFINLNFDPSFLSTGQVYLEDFKLCDISKILKNGDLIEVIYQCSTETLRRQFYVNGADCFNISLTPDLGTPICGEGAGDNIITNIDFRIIKSSNQNKLANELTTINVFKPDTIPNTSLPRNLFVEESEIENYGISKIEWEQRQTLVNALNNKINEICSTYSSSLSNTASHIPLQNMGNGMAGSTLYNNEFIPISPQITLSPDIEFSLEDISNLPNPINLGINSNLNLGFQFTNLNSSEFAPNFTKHDFANTSTIDYYYTFINTSNQIKVGSQIYAPYVLYLNLELDNRYINSVKSLNGQLINQKFASLIYKSTTSSDIIKPEFKVNSKGNIEFIPIYQDLNNYFYDLKFVTYDKINNVITSISDVSSGSVIEVHNFINTTFTGTLKDNLNHSLDNNVKWYAKRAEFIRQRQLSYISEGFKFSNKLEKNLINVPSLSNKQQFLGIAALEYEKVIPTKINDNFSKIFDISPTTNDIDITLGVVSQTNNSINNRYKLNNILYPAKSFTFTKSTHALNNSNPNIYNNTISNFDFVDNNSIISDNFRFLNIGTINDTIKLFNWNDEAQNTHYNKNIENIDFNRNLEVLTFKDNLDINGGLSYDDYINIVPNFFIKNVNPKSAFYQNFENYKTLFNNYTNAINNNSNLSKEFHTGNYAFRLNVEYNSDSDKELSHFLPNIIKTSVISENPNKDYIIEAWIKYSYDFITDTLLESQKDQILQNHLKNVLKVNLYSVATNDLRIAYYNRFSGSLPSNLVTSIDLVKIQRVGDWYLVRGKINNVIDSIETVDPDSENLVFEIETAKVDASTEFEYLSNPYILIDDIRFFNKDAEMVSYVYDWDNGLKISSILDNNHIPVKYINNQKGELSKIKMSTIEGEKLIQDSHLNVIKTSKNDFDGFQVGVIRSNVLQNNYLQSNHLNSQRNEVTSKIVDNLVADTLETLSNVNQQDNNLKKQIVIDELKNETLNKVKPKITRQQLHNNKALKQLLGNEKPKEVNEGKQLDWQYKSNLFEGNSPSVDSTKTKIKN